MRLNLVAAWQSSGSESPRVKRRRRTVSNGWRGPMSRLRIGRWQWLPVARRMLTDGRATESRHSRSIDPSLHIDP